jgi:hypothetical protein
MLVIPRFVLVAKCVQKTPRGSAATLNGPSSFECTFSQRSSTPLGGKPYPTRWDQWFEPSVALPKAAVVSHHSSIQWSSTGSPSAS